MSPHPEDGGAEVWLFEPSLLDGPDLLTILDGAERAKHDRFHYERDRQLYRTSHALLRVLLARYDNRPPESWQFRAGPHGRPAIWPEHPWLRFNISHCDGLVAVAIARNCQVGVDVERVVCERVDEDLARAVFSSSELAAFLALDAEERVRRFFLLWTCKEAYIKGRGMGLSLPLDRITIALKAAPRVSVDRTIDDGRAWKLEHRELASHHLAVALDGDGAISIRRAERALLDW